MEIEFITIAVSRVGILQKYWAYIRGIINIVIDYGNVLFLTMTQYIFIIENNMATVIKI